MQILSDESVIPVQIWVKLKPSHKLKHLKQSKTMLNQMIILAPNLADITKPLYDLLSTKNKWTWGLMQEEAFNKTKNSCLVWPQPQNSCLLWHIFIWVRGCFVTNSKRWSSIPSDICDDWHTIHGFDYTQIACTEGNLIRIHACA